MRILFLVIILSCLIYSEESPCENERYIQLKSKMEYQLTAEEKYYLQEYTKRCIEQNEEDSDHHPGRVFLIIGIVILTLGVVNSAISTK